MRNGVIEKWGHTPFELNNDLNSRSFREALEKL